MNKAEKNKKLYRKCINLNLWTEDRRLKISKKYSGKGNTFYGKTHSVEYKKILSKNWSGEKNPSKSMTIYTKLKISKSNLGHKGPTISDEGLKKLRIKEIEIEIDRYNGNQMIPLFNKKSCIFFDKLDSIMNWNGIYATKGKEYKIESLGYFVDYYEPNRNVVIEWDEKNHYTPIGKL